MEWLNRMSQAIEYLEGHLADGALSMEETARVACASPFHFQRMFLMLTGFTVGEYVRKRRLTLAAQELVSSRKRIIEIALTYGYDTPESFTRAFRKLHGITPSAARGQGVMLKVYPRLSFQITLKGEQAMDYQIIEHPAFKVVGKGIRVSNQNGQNLKEIPKFWRECYQNGFCVSLEEMADPKGVTGQSKLGICMESEPEKHELCYLIGVENTQGIITEGMMEKEIPAATWAIFQSTGPMPQAIQNLSKRIYSEWFPSTGYERDGDLDIEVYPPGNDDDPNYHAQIWIPIVKK